MRKNIIERFFDFDELAALPMKGVARLEPNDVLN
jgi:hypothetical protein